MLLAVDADGKSFSNVAILRNARVAVAARDRRRRAAAIPGQFEARAIFSVDESDGRSVRQEPFIAACARNLEALSKRALQLVVTAELGLTAQRRPTEIDERGLASASSSYDRVEPGVERDLQRLRSSQVLSLVDDDALDCRCRVKIGIGRGACRRGPERVSAVEQRQAETFGVRWSF